MAGLSITTLTRFRSCNEYVHSILRKWYYAERSNQFLNISFRFDISEVRLMQSSRPFLRKLPRLEIRTIFPTD